MQNAHENQFDLVIIGAGPAGLAAAVYASREGMKTVVLDKGVAGGLAAITDNIDNYPGFNRGVGGLELADRLLAHATRFGAEVRTGVEVTGLNRDGEKVVVHTAGDPLYSDAALVATGSTYKFLGIPGEKEMIGRGVHFCATCDAPLYRGKDIIVVGGGNSAIQESLFIAKFADHVTLIVRGPELGGTQILQEQLKALPNVSFRFDTVVKAIRNDGTKVTGVEAKHKPSDDTLHIRTDGIFVFIGLTANTRPFANSLDLDMRNFITTHPDFSTSLEGVYAAGDVRSGSTWQIASAIGEGVAATLEIRKHLDKLKHARAKAKREAPHQVTSHREPRHETQTAKA
jgi:thioredoxin reductase (NADPH)